MTAPVEFPHLETYTATVWGVDDVDLIGETVALEVNVIRYRSEGPARIYVHERDSSVDDNRNLLRLTPDKAQKLADALLLAIEQAKVQDSIALPND